MYPPRKDGGSLIFASTDSFLKNIEYVFFLLFDQRCISRDISLARSFLLYPVCIHISILKEGEGGICKIRSNANPTGLHSEGEKSNLTEG